MEEQVHSIGSHALFLGAFRSMSIHADVFPSVNANCIYYQKEEEEEEEEEDGSRYTYTYEYDLAHDKVDKVADSANIYPASILQLLVEYSMCCPRYKPAYDQVDREIAQQINSMDSFFQGMDFAQMVDDLQELEVDDDGYYPFVE